MKKIGVVALFLALSSFAGLNTASAQIVTDTIPILVIQGRMASVQAASVTGPFRVGDSIQFQAQAFDTQGDPVDAVYTWTQESVDTTTTPPTVIYVGDPAIQIDATTGLGVFLRKLYPGETLNIIVAAQQVDQLTMGWFRTTDGPAALSFADSSFVQVGGYVQYCAYLLYRGQLVAQNQGDVLSQCPFAFGAPPADHQVDSFWTAPELWYKRGLESLLRGLVNLAGRWGDIA